MKIIKSAIFSIILVFSNNTIACKFISSNQSTEERIISSTEAFIGTVVKIEENNVIFKIEQDLKKKNRTFFEIVQGNTSCHNRYELNDQWLYLGNSFPSGSILLRRNGQEINNYK